MKKLLLLGAALIGSFAHASEPIKVLPEHVPAYIQPVSVIDATSVKWSFDMVREPEILPIIPETSFEVRVVDEVTITDYKLLSDILFAFDKHTVDMKNEIFVKDIADHILSTYQSLDSITVTGHTDRLGSDKYNQDLSVRRANTVKNLLEAYGLPIGMIQARGVGESQPTTDGCSNIKNKPLLKECLKEDRRVEISVYGKANIEDTKIGSTSGTIDIVE